MEFKELKNLIGNKLRDIYDATVQQGITLEKQLNEDLPGVEWGVVAEWNGDINIYLMIQPLMAVPEGIDSTHYVSIDILPEIKIDCVIGVSKSDVEFMKEHKGLMKDENIAVYYETMYRLLDYMNKMEV